MIIPEVIYSTVANKCPRCHKGQVFKSSNPYSFGRIFDMEEVCSCCELRYEREPGFFFGAMYVSYALFAGIFINWFLIDLLWLHLEPMTLFGLVAGTMALLFPLAFRWARLLWLNFFVRYEKKYRTHLKITVRN